MESMESMDSEPESEPAAAAVETGPLPLLAVDIGNSATNIAQFEPALLEARFALPEPTWVENLSTFSNPYKNFAAKLPPRARWRVASAHGDSQRRLQRSVTENRPADAYLNFTFREIPIEVRVDYLEKVGLDRIVAAVATNVLRDSMRPAVVIDAGTALKVDLVSVSRAFEGGVILPGFHLTARALRWHRASRNSCIARQSLAEARLPPGGKTTPHDHPGTEEIYYILEGAARMQIGEDVHMVGPGDAIAIPPGAIHTIQNTGSITLKFLCCCAPGYENDDTVMVGRENQ